MIFTKVQKKHGNDLSRNEMRKNNEENPMKYKQKLLRKTYGALESVAMSAITVGRMMRPIDFVMK